MPFDFLTKGYECKLISSRECRTYAILIAIITIVLAIVGAVTGTGLYPRWFLALFCGWVFVWPLARLSGYMMNMTIFLHLQELNPAIKDTLEQYKKARYRKSYLNSQFIIRKDDLEGFVADFPEDVRELMYAERDMAQRVVTIWTHIYFWIIPILAVGLIVLWG